MDATSRPLPGSPAAVLDSVVRAVSEGRYRMAQLQLQWHSERAPLHEMADLITSATAIPLIPAGLSAESVVASSRSALLPVCLEHHIDNEVHRIFSGQSTAGASPLQLVARVVAAVCIDVATEKLDAAHRAAQPDAAAATGIGPNDGIDPASGADPPTPSPATRRSLIHLGVPDTIDLDEPQHVGHHPIVPPPPR